MRWARRDLACDCSQAPPIGPVLYRGRSTQPVVNISQTQMELISACPAGAEHLEVYSNRSSVSGKNGVSIWRTTLMASDNLFFSFWTKSASSGSEYESKSSRSRRVDSII